MQMITQLKKEHLYGSHIPAGIERSDITNFFGTIGECHICAATSQNSGLGRSSCDSPSSKNLLRQGLVQIHEMAKCVGMASYMRW